MRLLLFTALILFLGQVHADTAVEPSEPAQQGPRPSAEAMVVDGLLLRPLLLASTAIGTGIFIVTLPFSLLGGNADGAAQTLVLDPAQETFTRCLGCLDRYGGGPDY